MPKFSIIVPIFNVEKYLSKCLDSLINQTYKDIEIICVNDGSTDNSLNILTDYTPKDNRIIIINQKHQGVSVTRNIGIDNANGAYILFVDSDDWLELNACEILNDLTSKNPNIDLVCFRHYDTTNNIRKTLISELINDSKLKGEFYFKDICNQIKDSAILLTLWNKLFKASLIKDNNLRFNSKLSWFEDGIFIMQYMMFNPKIILDNAILYNYRNQRENSLTNDSILNLYTKRKKAYEELFLYKLNNKNINKETWNTYIDSYLYQYLRLWRSLYFTNTKNEYVNLLKQILELYIEPSNDLRILKMAQNQILISKLHLSWWYWKIVFQIGKYLFVLPYRKIKSYLRRKNGK